MLDFPHRLLRRIISRESSPVENDWDALLGFEFVDAQLLSISKCMEETEFRTKATRDAKGCINVEKEKSRKSKTGVIASAVMGDMINPHVNQGEAYIRHLCAELLKHPTFKIWSRSCHPVQSCPNEKIHRMFSNRVVCVWGT